MTTKKAKKQTKQTAAAASAKKGSSRAKQAVQGASKGKAAKQSQPAPEVPTPASTPRTTHAGSKTANILDLLQREGGATLQELMTATGWQAHSVRGFLSGTIGKKMGTPVNSTRREDGTRVYTLNS